MEKRSCSSVCSFAETHDGVECLKKNVAYHNWQQIEGYFSDHFSILI